ncbi:MAG: hypothetical protein ACYDH8_12220 [Syntrophales bacterium]
MTKPCPLETANQPIEKFAEFAAAFSWKIKIQKQSGEKVTPDCFPHILMKPADDFIGRRACKRLMFLINRTSAFWFSNPTLHIWLAAEAVTYPHRSARLGENNLNFETLHHLETETWQSGELETDDTISYLGFFGL